MKTRVKDSAIIRFHIKYVKQDIKSKHLWRPGITKVVQPYHEITLDSLGDYQSPKNKYVLLKVTIFYYLTCLTPSNYC